MRGALRSPRIKELRRRHRKRNLGVLILFLTSFIVFALGLSLLLRIKGLQLNEVKITGNKIINKEEIEELVNGELDGNYLFLFPKRNSLIYPRVQIYNKLILSFPRIENLFIYTEKLKTLKLEIEERAGHCLYCGAEVPETKEEVGENCYFVDQEGYIFDKAPYFSGDIYFKYYKKLENEDLDPSGLTLLPKEEFKKLNNFVKRIRELKFNPVYLSIDSNNTGHLYLEEGKNHTSPKIIFKCEEDLDKILENFDLAMKKIEFKEDITKKYDSLLYIDTRFKDKVLYKFND